MALRESLENIPSGALAAFVNMLLILMTIWIGNASDYLRETLEKDKRKRCWGFLHLLTDIPDATIGVLVGIAAGLVLEKTWKLRVRFSDQVFFYAVLPPIIFYQGYSLKKRRFFKYFHYIVTLGVLGTLLHFGVLVLAFVLLNRLWLLLRLPVNPNLETTGLLRDEVLLLCSVLSSADEVAALALIKQEQYPKLSAVLFGEGVLNDAVSILLFRTILTGAVTGRSGVWAGLGLLGMALYLLVCSTLVGLAVSLAIARFLKVNTGLLQHPTRQTIIIMLGSYVSYAASELFEVPGVLSVFVCGIIFSHFAWHSLAPEAQIGTAVFSHGLSSAAEMYSFTGLGLSVYRFQPKDWSIRYTCISLAGLLIARAVVVFGTFGLTGRLAPRHFAMSRPDQWVLFGAGLIRGAITWAQALQMQGTNRRVMISTTLIVISATLVVVGGLLPSLLRLLGLVQNELQDAGEMEGVHEALSCRQQDSSLPNSGGGGGGGSTGGMPSFSSPYDIAEAGPALSLSRQTSARAAEEGDVEGVPEEATPLVASTSNASDPAMPTRPPPLHLPPGGPHAAPNGGQLSWNGPVLYGPVHRAWINLDERILKPVFGGRSRAATPWASYVGGVAPTPHGSFASDTGGSGGQIYRHPPSYGAVAVGGGRGAQGHSNRGGNGNGGGSGSGELDPEALQKAFAERGFRIHSSSFVKAAAGPLAGKPGNAGGGGGGKA